MLTPDNWAWGDLKPLHYQVIVADCAWEYETWSELGAGRSPGYDTMSLEEIMELRVADLARSDCVLALWIIDSLLDRAFEVLDSWGFTFKTVGFYWAKTIQNPDSVIERIGQGAAELDDLFPIGMGRYTRGNPETCLFATRFRPPKRLKADVPKLIVAPKREHSRKPDEFYTRMERLYAGPRCDLFSRQRRPGWDAWGNQTDHFGEIER